MTGLEQALLGLRQALDAPRRHGVWRGLVRNRMAAVKDALGEEWARTADAGLASREVTLVRERNALLRRLATLGTQILDAPDVESVREELKRLTVDLEHHRQRINDLVYDSVALELGGSD
jgi:hypothetical protein